MAGGLLSVAIPVCLGDVQTESLPLWLMCCVCFVSSVRVCSVPTRSDEARGFPIVRRCRLTVLLTRSDLEWLEVDVGWGDDF